MDLGRYSVPLAAGLAAAAAAFAVVVLTTDSGDGERPVPASSGPAPATAVPGGTERGADVFARMGCGGCHTLAAAGSTGTIGPDLDGVLPSHTRRSLTAVILSPPTGSPMPTDFGERMTGPELQALVTFLLATRDER